MEEEDCSVHLQLRLWQHPPGTILPSWEQKGKLLCPSQDQELDLNSCRIDTTHLALPHTLKLKHTSLLAAFRTRAFLLVDVFFFTAFCDLLSWVDLLLSCGGPWVWGGGVQQGPSKKGQRGAGTFWWHCCCSVVSGRLARRQMMGSLSTSGKQVLLNH